MLNEEVFFTYERDYQVMMANRNERQMASPLACHRQDRPRSLSLVRVSTRTIIHLFVLHSHGILKGKAQITLGRQPPNQHRVSCPTDCQASVKDPCGKGL